MPQPAFRVEAFCCFPPCHPERREGSEWKRNLIVASGLESSQIPRDVRNHHFFNDAIEAWTVIQPQTTLSDINDQ